MTPELDVLKQPGHLDVEAMVTDKDGRHDVVVVRRDLSVVVTEVITLVPVVEAEEFRGKDGLDGVQKRGVLGVSTRSPSVKTHDLKKVGFVNQAEDVPHVLGLVVDVGRVLLVAESIYVALVKTISLSLGAWKNWSRRHTNDEVPKDMKGKLLVASAAHVKLKLRLLAVLLEHRLNDMKNPLAGLVLVAVLLIVLEATTSQSEGGSLEDLHEATAPEGAAVGINRLASGLADASKGSEILVGKEEGNVLVELHEGR